MYKIINSCRCCKSNKLIKYLDLGNQPLANSYHKDEKLEYFPLEVNLCQQCHHSQLSVVVEPTLMFKDYKYVSGTTLSFRYHCQKLAKEALKCIRVDKVPRVLDIAANDCTLLGYFRDLGCVVQGVDPAENLRAITLEKKIPVVVGYWNKDMAKELGTFDVITATNVFAHVNDIDEFLEAAYLALDEEGTLIIEFPYCENMIKDVEFDTIYHEHLSYFLVNSFVTVVHRFGFTITDIVKTLIHGGSIRFFCMKMPTFETYKVKEMIEAEEKAGLYDPDTYFKFAKKVDVNKCKTLESIKQLKDAGEKVIGYGAAAKGMTALNYFGLDLDYIVDDNPLKLGFKTPGRNISICSPDVLTDEVDNLNIVVLAWNFYDEVRKKIIAKRNGKSSCLIVYVPNLKMEMLESV